MDYNYRMYSVIRVFFVVGLFCVPFGFAHGQENTLGSKVLSCPDYTSGGNVEISLSTELTSTVSAVPVGVRAVVQNVSGTEIYDGALYARVTGVSGGKSIVVDEFLAADDIDIAASGTKEEIFIWRVPSRVTAGDYRVDVFFVYPRSLFIPPPGAESQDAAALTMRVESELQSVVHIDRADIEVSGAEQSSTAYAFQENAPVGVRIPVVNDTDMPYKGTITWRLYPRGKGPLTTPLAEFTENVEIHPRTTVEKSYVFPETAGSSYYLEADLSDGMSRSMVALLFLREGVCAPADVVPAPRNTTLWVFAVAFVAALVGYAILQKWTLSRS